ncbi:G-protein beta WD-40 repeat containing protein [Tritrichomonas foetus]|uniref:G-protein beta WD-40 repeat containing protein n=1 Tax=Tritrichomonas foetus TaxID=1144522 RepID=A0A1J4KCR7_9EUKA|nr:G-protein beta WD-40 repeat containing protein [Tritrichomonas foetus]|eukprot:OHT07492.1 G-protein beta WD-40 repeat containing protein [Tritrichomonas foetus]
MSTRNFKRKSKFCYFIMQPSIIKSFNVTKGELLCSAPFIKSMYVAGGTSNGTVMLFPFNPQETRSRRLVGHRAAVTCMCVSQHPLWLATGSEDTTVRLWQIRGNDDSCTTLEPNDGSIRAIAISPNADRLLVAGRLSNPTLWDPFDKSIVQTFDHHDSIINAVALSTKTGVAVTGSSDGKCRIFDIRSGDFLRSVDCFSPITALSINTEGTVLAIGTAVGNVSLVNVETGQITQSSRIHNQDVNSLMIQPNGNLLLTGSADNTVILSDATKLEPIFTLNIHKDKVIDVHFSTDGDQFTTCSIDHKIYLWTSPDLTLQEDEPSDSNLEEEDEEITLPKQKAPPMPQPKYNSDQNRHFESDGLSPYLQSPSPVKRHPAEKSPQSQTDVQMSPQSHGLSDLSEPSMTPIRDRFGKLDNRKKTKNLVSVIKQQPVTIEQGSYQDEFNMLLRQCASEIDNVAKILINLGQKLKENDERIAHIEAVQVARAERAMKKASARRNVRK